MKSGGQICSFNVIIIIFIPVMITSEAVPHLTARLCRQNNTDVFLSEKTLWGTIGTSRQTLSGRASNRRVRVDKRSINLALFQPRGSRNIDNRSLANLWLTFLNLRNVNFVQLYPVCRFNAGFVLNTNDPGTRSRESRSVALQAAA